MKLHRAHKICLNPGSKQIEYFKKACGTSRFTWNWALAEWKKQYDLGEKPSGFKLDKQFNSIKKEQFPWIYEISSCSSQRAILNLDKAFMSFFKKEVKYPKFKKKGYKDSFYITNTGLKLKDKKVRVPKLGWIKATESLRLEGKILSATISRQADKWYIAINVEIDAPAPSENQVGAVGVDLGVKALATLSDGTVIEGPKAYKNSLKKLRILNKSLSRKQKGSNRREKAKIKLARQHVRVANIRKDSLHKLTYYLIQNYEIIGIEDLDVQEMVKNKYLARSILDQGFYEFKRQLEYKAEPENVTVVKADRFFPSTKMCSDCGFVMSNLPLSVREWICPNCGVIHNRDGNASINLENMAVALTASARGEKISPIRQISVKRESQKSHKYAKSLGE